jgi:pimeloyl-ACP methyl ester carboxylesterase
MRHLRFGILAPLLLLIGCAAQPTNPSFPIAVKEGELDLHRMSEDRKPLTRPLVVIGGFLDPGVGAWVLESEFSAVTSDRRIIGVSLAECMSFDDCRRKMVQAVDRAWPTSERSQTVEVDVVGLSMGGVAARYAALPLQEKGRRLKIARLFTISSPHRGAEDAQRLPLLHPLQKSLRPDSTFYAKLEASPCDYAIIPYVRLGDHVVGTQYSAPKGQSPWWVPDDLIDGPPHAGAFLDPRIISDIARRLRGEAPSSINPPAPLPKVA